MKRLNNIFSTQKNHLMISTVCGAQNREESEAALHQLIQNGADILNLAIPFSDPVADSITAQAAAQKALENGATPLKIFQMVERVREKHPETGMILSGYYNIFLQLGAENLFQWMKKLEIDGLLIIDLPFEEQEELLPFNRKYEIPLIQVIGRFTPRERMKMILKNAEGFVFYLDDQPDEQQIKTIQEVTQLPVAAKKFGTILVKES